MKSSAVSVSSRCRKVRIVIPYYVMKCVTIVKVSTFGDHISIASLWAKGQENPLDPEPHPESGPRAEP